MYKTSLGGSNVEPGSMACAVSSLRHSIFKTNHQNVLRLLMYMGVVPARAARFKSKALPTRRDSPAFEGVNRRPLKVLARQIGVGGGLVDGKRGKGRGWGQIATGRVPEENFHAGGPEG